MSTPTLDGQQTGQDPQDRVDRYARELLAIEQAAVRAVTLHLIYTLTALRRQATGRVLLAAAQGAQATAASALARELAAMAAPLVDPGPLVAAVEQEAQRAIDLAAAYTLGPANPFVPVLAPEVEVERAMRSAAASAGDRITQAVRDLTRADTPAEVAGALTTAEQAVGSLATGAEYAVNSAANSAPRRLAVALGQRLVWVAERDACVVCLALSGQVVDPNIGEAFDEFATFDTKPAPSVWPPGMPLTQPPRHPHCRCIIQVWDGSAGPGADWPDRLRHEALRSVARGWSLPSESNAARLRAAHHILTTGKANRLPKSVRAEAVRSVARHRFTNRTAP